MILYFLFLLFLPTLNYGLFIGVTSSIIGLVYKLPNSISRKNILLILILIISILTGRGIINNDFQEIEEVLKITFIVLILSGSFKEKHIEALIKANKIFVVILFLTVLYQWIDPYNRLWSQLSNILYSHEHYLGGIKLRYPRANGLMTNIAEAAFYFSINSVYFFNCIKKEPTKFNTLLYLISITGVLLTQSKTIILIQFIIIFIQIMFFSKNWIKIAIATISILSTTIIVKLISNLDQIQRLMTVGLATSSMKFRINSWLNLINSYKDSTIFELIFGIGRQSYIKDSITLDSDLFYTLQLFGLMGVFLLIYFLLQLGIKTKYMTASLKYQLLAMLPITFFLDIIYNPKMAIIIYLFLNIFQHEDFIRMRKLQIRKNYQ